MSARSKRRHGSDVIEEPAPLKEFDVATAWRERNGWPVHARALRVGDVVLHQSGGQLAITSIVECRDGRILIRCRHAQDPTGADFVLGTFPPLAGIRKVVE
jgi:hypothetical protein